MNLCPNLTSARDSLKTEPPAQKKVFPIPRKPNIPKKNLEST